MIVDIPKGISKTKYKDEVIIITPELEIVLRNILDMGKRPGLEFYKMKDFSVGFLQRDVGARRDTLTRSLDYQLKLSWVETRTIFLHYVNE